MSDQDFRIVPLSPDNVEEATTLVHSIFPTDANHDPNPGKAFLTSLYPDRYPPLGSDYLDYYVAENSSTGEVVGTTGLYHIRTDPQDTVWLGWYCVKENSRGKGLGKLLLQYAIDLSLRQGRKRLCVYADSESVEAIHIYDKAGFRKVKEEKMDDMEGWVKVTMALDIYRLRLR